MDSLLINQPYHIVDPLLAQKTKFKIVAESSIVVRISDQLPEDVYIIVEHASHNISELVFIIERTEDIIINMQVNLIQSQGNFNCIGIYAANNVQLQVNFVQQHMAFDTEGSFNLYGIAYDRANINFYGNLIIHKNAQASVGSMIHKTMIAGKDVVVKTIPNLEIQTNNVSCKHAAAIQQIDTEELFYLQSKGYNDQLAKNLVIKGFLQGSEKHIRNSISQQFFRDQCVLL